MDVRTIGVILNDDSKQGLNHTYFSEILESAKVWMQSHGIILTFLNNDRDYIGALTYKEQLDELGCVGCIIACQEYNEEIQEILDSEYEVGSVDFPYDGVVCVSSDNNSGIEMLAEYIVRMGHKRIAYIMGDDNEVTNKRLNGFLRVCEKNQIKIPEEYICRGKFRDMEKAQYNTEKLMNLPTPPTCIMYSDDYASIGGINVLNSRGLIIGKDISVSGFDGNEILYQLEPRMATIKQDGAMMGEILAQKMINNIESSKKEYGMFLVDTLLIEGRTIARVYE